MDEWRNQGIIDMNQPIEHVIFRTRGKAHAKDINLKCTVRFIIEDLMIIQISFQTLFCFFNKQVDYNAFTAINQSSLVFDGRLVIDEHNRTNDSIIYAGGPLTKFKRGYYRDDWTHACFNSKEVGHMVG